MEFIDDYRLLIGVGRTANTPPSLVLIDTESDEGGTPIQTFFYLPRFYEDLFFILERGMHKPSPAEYMAPFHQDPTQRIIVLETRFPSPSLCLVVRAGAFLQLLKDHEGARIRWDEWKHHVVIPLYRRRTITHEVRVSGCRLFSISSTDYRTGFQIEVYDFSMQGRKKYLSENEKACGGLGAMRFLSSTGAGANIPWDMLPDLYGHSGHDSIAFFHVSALMPSFLE